MDRSWIVHGSSMDRAWIVHGSCMDHGIQLRLASLPSGRRADPKGQALVFGNPSDRTSLPLKQNTLHLKSRDSIGSVA
jgi:hypothetical protein